MGGRGVDTALGAYHHTARSRRGGVANSTALSRVPPPINELAIFAQERARALTNWQPAHPHVALTRRYTGTGSRTSGGSRSLSLLHHSVQLRW